MTATTSLPYSATPGLPELSQAQRDELESILAIAADGRWVTFDQPVSSRELLDARAIIGLFVLDEDIVWASTSVYDAFDSFHRLRRQIETSPELMEHVRAFRAVNGEQVISLHNGGHLLFTPITSSGIRGTTADCLLLEGDLDPEYRKVAVPCVVSRPNPQVVSYAEVRA